MKKKTITKNKIVALLIMALLLQTACSKGNVVVTEIPVGNSNTPTPTAIEVEYTPEASESPTPTEDALPTENAATATPEPSATAVPSETATPSETVEPSVTEEPSVTPEPSATNQPSETPTPSTSVEPTVTVGPTDVVDQTPTVAPTEVVKPTAEATLTPTDTPAPTVTPTTAAQSSATPTPTELTKNTPTPTNTNTPTPTNTNTPVPTNTSTPTPTNTNTPVPTNTSTPTPTNTNTPVPTNTSTPVPTNTNTPIPTNTNTPIPTNTNTPIPTNTNTPVPTSTNTPIPTSTNTPKPNGTSTPSPMPTKTAEQRVSYKDDAVDTSEIQYNISNSKNTKEEIIAKLVQSVYGQNGLTCTVYNSFFSNDKNVVLDAAKTLAAIKGVEWVKIEETNRWNNLSMFVVTVKASTPFRYHYAIDTGDSSYMTSEDQQVVAALKQLVEEAKKYATDYEKEKFFHDYLVSNIAYGTVSGYSGQTPYEALILKKCVCNGYASTFELLMNMSGIPCSFVTGTGNGGGHAWNQVLLNGAWYNVDVTWDDPTPDVAGRVVYTYLNVNDDFFYRDHRAEDTGIPICFATEYNAVVMTYHECKNQEEANAYSKEKVDSGENYVEFLYTGETSLSIQELVNAVGKGVSYYTDATAVGYVYRITFK